MASAEAADTVVPSPIVPVDRKAAVYQSGVSSSGAAG